MDRLAKVRTGLSVAALGVIREQTLPGSLRDGRYRRMINLQLRRDRIEVLLRRIQSPN